MPNNKICITSDIHLGLHQSNEKWHNICLEFAKWLDKNLKERGVGKIAILGDLLDDRNEISVTTLHTMSLFFDILKDYEIIITVGNHDCYYNTRSDIHSLGTLKGHKNVKVIDEIEEVIYNGKRVSFCPWHASIDDINPCDIIMGHFEIISFKMNGGHVCKNGLESIALLDKADMVFSGHFHKTENREYKKGNIIYTGSPFQQSWGEYGQEKGVYVLDTDNMNIEFIENRTSPRHIKVRLTDILEKREKINKFSPNNIINLQINTGISHDNLNAIVLKIYSFKPISLKIDSIVDESSLLSFDEEIEYTGVDIKQTLIDYIQNAEQISDKEKYIKYLTEIYNKCKRGE